jgi:hypothetical protein
MGGEPGSVAEDVFSTAEEVFSTLDAHPTARSVQVIVAVRCRNMIVAPSTFRGKGVRLSFDAALGQRVAATT